MPLNNKNKHMAGGTSYYTEELGQRIASRIVHGCNLTEAAVSEGVPYRTAYDWVHKYPEFAAALEVAKSRAISDKLALINNHARKDWKAAQWLLEKADPKRFGPKIEVEVSLNQLEELSDEDLLQIVTSSQLPNSVASSGLIGTAKETEEVITGELVP